MTAAARTVRVFGLGDALRLFLKHPASLLLLSLFLCFVVSRAVLGSPWSYYEAAVGLVVMLYWPFQEWWMHRWLLHLPPVRLGKRTVEFGFARVHRLHHENPKSIPLSFLPVSVIVVALCVFMALAYVVTGSVAWMCTFMIAATLSTMIYEWTHYLTHTDYRPKGRYFRKVSKLHRWHHYKHEGYWFSFTVPWIDTWMGTAPNVNGVPRSPTARSLRDAPSVTINDGGGGVGGE